MCGLHEQRVGNVLAGWRSALVCWGLFVSVFASAAEPGRSAAPPTGTAPPVVLKLHWYPQAQFAGCLLAQDKEFFRAAGLGDVEIRWSTAGAR